MSRAYPFSTENRIKMADMWAQAYVSAFINPLVDAEDEANKFLDRYIKKCAELNITPGDRNEQQVSSFRG